MCQRVIRARSLGLRHTSRCEMAGVSPQPVGLDYCAASGYQLDCREPSDPTAFLTPVCPSITHQIHAFRQQPSTFEVSVIPDL